MKQKKAEKNVILDAFLECRDVLVRSIMKMSVRPEDVDDILQETFLRAFSANEKSHITSPRDYLFVISRNLVLKGLSRRSREITQEIDEALLQAEGISAGTELHYRRKFEAFNKALYGLPEKQRRAILLRKFYGLSHREIAGKMNVSVSSVEKYIAGGVKRCKQALCAQGYEMESQSLQLEQSHPREAAGRVADES